MVLTSYIPSNGTVDILSYVDKPVPQSLLAKLNVPNSVSAAIGIGGTQALPRPVNDSPALTSNGKPLILYIGSEYCPFCALERWPLIIALSRFGNFSNLHYMASGPAPEIYPDTPTFTFINSTYSSPYIAFESVELTNRTNGAHLQNTTPEEDMIMAKYDTEGSIPFIDFANHSVIIGGTFSPAILDGKDWNQIVNSLVYPNSSTAQGVVGSANLMTAEICKINNNTPSSVCSQSYVQQIENNLK